VSEERGKVRIICWLLLLLPWSNHAKMAFAERKGITDTINKSYGCSEAITALLCH